MRARQRPDFSCSVFSVLFFPLHGCLLSGAGQRSRREEKNPAFCMYCASYCFLSCGLPHDRKHTAPEVGVRSVSWFFASAAPAGQYLSRACARETRRDGRGGARAEHVRLPRIRRTRRGDAHPRPVPEPGRVRGITQAGAWPPRAAPCGPPCVRHCTLREGGPLSAATAARPKHLVADAGHMVVGRWLGAALPVDPARRLLHQHSIFFGRPPPPTAGGRPKNLSPERQQTESGGALRAV